MANGTPSAQDADIPAWERPPADMVTAAERNHRDTLGRHDEIIATVRCLLARGYTDIEAMAHVTQAFSALVDLSTTWFLAALSVVERAKVPGPPPIPEQHTSGDTSTCTH